MPTNAIQEVDLISIEQVQPSGIGKEFYTEIKDGCKSTENFLSCLATLRHILGLWNRSMYGHQTKLNVIWN